MPALLTGSRASARPLHTGQGPLPDNRIKAMAWPFSHVKHPFLRTATEASVASTRCLCSVHISVSFQALLNGLVL